MAIGISKLSFHPRFAGALFAVSLAAAWLASAVPLAAADAPRFEIKHIGPDDRVTVESPLDPVDAAGNPRTKLVPFPEDEAEAPSSTKGTGPVRQQPVAQRVEPVRPAPVRLTPPKASTFKPKFKTPAVRAVQHTEPVAADPADTAKPASANEPLPASQLPTSQPIAASPAEESTGPLLQPIPIPDAQDSPGKTIIDEAFAKSKQAATEAEYAEVIEMCRQGAKAGLKKGYEEYARKLLSWTYNRRGELRVRAGQSSEALADFEAAVKCSATSWRALHNRGVSYAAMGKWRDALADFNRTIELNKDYGNAYFNRAEVKASQADIPGAIRDYNSALALNPRDATIYSSRGYAYYRLRRFGEALRDYSSALEVDPAFAPALINRGDVHTDLSHYAEAASDYRAAVEANPKLAKGYQSAAWLMATCPDEHYRNDKLAVEAARKAVELSGQSDYRCLETLAAALANAGEYAEAQRTQEQAVAMASPIEAPTAQQRLAIYQREQPYREQPRVSFAAEEGDEQVRKASANAPERAPRRPSRPNFK